MISNIYLLFFQFSERIQFQKKDCTNLGKNLIIFVNNNNNNFSEIQLFKLEFNLL